MAPPPASPVRVRAQGPVQHRRPTTRIVDNPFLAVAKEPLSTFSIDVDTASYANVRRFLNGGSLPPADAVRIEELINYFRLRLPAADRRRALRGHDRAGARARGTRSTAWRSIGLKAQALDRRTRPPRNLVFLVDVSGSMASPDKLPLVKHAPAAARRHAAASATASRSSSTPGASGPRAAVDARATSKRTHPRGDRAARGRRLDQRRRGHRARLPGRARALHQGRHQPRHPRTDGDFNVGVTSQGELIAADRGEARRAASS